MRMALEKITPQIAETMLKYNKSNRMVRRFDMDTEPFPAVYRP